MLFFMSVIYKLLERLILNRIGPSLEGIIPMEQARFPSRRSCAYIEAVFHQKLKTSVAFVDLKPAYNTIWRDSLICKCFSVIPCMHYLTICWAIASLLNFLTGAWLQFLEVNIWHLIFMYFCDYLNAIL